jgi:hypothetical protein
MAGIFQACNNSQFMDEGQKDMHSDPKLRPNAIIMAIDKLLHPLGSGEFGSMIGLLPVPGHRTELCSNANNIDNVSACYNQLTLVSVGQERHGGSKMRGDGLKHSTR